MDQNINCNENSFELDTTSRNRIVANTDSNFFVEAGAGSGKTTMLVNRMVSMVEQGKDISKICAITFTKAAAGEFYDRFRKILLERSNPNYEYEDKGYAGALPAPTEETRKRCAEALQNLDLCFMGTIDSFCNMVISEHPFDAGVPTDAGVISDKQLETVLKQEYIKISEGAYGDELKRYVSTFELLNEKPEETFVKGMRVFLENKNVHIHFEACENYEPGQISEMFAEKKENLLAALEVMKRRRHEAYFVYPADVGEAIVEAGHVLRLDWEKNLHKVVQIMRKLCEGEFKIDLLQDPDINVDLFQTANNSFGYPVAKLALDRREGLIEGLTNIQYNFCMTFFSKSAPTVERSLREKGYLTYSDYLYYLRNMLREDAKANGTLTRYIYERHQYFLIDEFQDTNPIQSEIFFYLAAEHPVEDWRACVPRPGALFIVGDPKQSIYRFRSADVRSYMNVRHMFEALDNCDVLYLTRNFRSREKLCRYFNRVFSTTLQESESQSGFTEIPLIPDTEDAFEGVYTYDAYTENARKNNPRLPADDRQICRIIHNLVDNDNYKIQDSENKKMRTLRYSDIMIIVYGKNYLSTLLPSMEADAIPVRVEGKVMFEKCDALREIGKLYHVLSYPDDKNAIYAALTGKLMGFREEEILQYMEEGGMLSVRLKNAKEFSKPVSVHVLETLRKLSSMSRLAATLSPSGLFYKIMEVFQIYRHVEADKLEIVYYTLELLRSAEKGGEVVSLPDGDAFIQKLLAGDAEQERCLSLADNGDFVHVANLHKVKGLEAPVVILAYAWPSDIHTDSSIVYQEEQAEGYFFKIRGNGKAGPYEKEILLSTNTLEDKVEDEKRVLWEERERLVYVAATRARNALIICNSMYCTKRGDVASSRWRNLIACADEDYFTYDARHGNRSAVPPVQKSPETETAEALYEQAMAESVFHDRTAEEDTYLVMNPSRMQIESKLEEEPVDEMVEMHVSGQMPAPREPKSSERSILHKCPTLLGTVVHRMLEMLIASKNQVAVEMAVEEILEEYITPDYEMYREALKYALLTIAQTMRAGGYKQSNQTQQDILQSLLSADEVYTEVPFCYVDRGEKTPVLYNGIMDVVYCEAGVWHIVDYKTNYDGSNLDAHYKAQLDAYKKAFKETTGQDADAGIYHIEV